MKTYGLELELFILKAGRYAFVKREEYSLPVDSCGYLAEARSEPHAKPREAVHLLEAAIERTHKTYEDAQYKLLKAPHVVRSAFPKGFFTEARRHHSKKDLMTNFFAHGGRYSDTSKIIRAGLHIHFGSKIDVLDAKGKFVTSYVGQQNMPRIIFLLDQAFKDEIRRSNRVTGEYELKPYGFEYRSLPSTVDLRKVIQVLEEIDHEV